MTDSASHSPQLAAPASIRVVDIDDLAALERHVTFEQAHGIARHLADEIQTWIATVDAAVLLDAVDNDGNLVGCATASMLAVMSPNSVQVNMHAAPGGPLVLRSLASSIEQWSGADCATGLMAHVSGPSLAQEEDWTAAGFTRLGMRMRLTRPVTPGDAEHSGAEQPGVRIVALRDVPELDDATLELWNSTHADIPTPLPFGPVDRAQWLREMEVGDREQMPASFLLAVTDDGEIAGLALLRIIDATKGIAGHRFTAVSPAWRGRGVASQLKVAMIRWAAHHGITELRASNDEENVAMRAINARLGYRELHNIVIFQRDIVREHATASATTTA